jgi:integrase
MPKTSRRRTPRAKGEGTLRQRKDGSWEARLTLGYDNTGKQQYKSLYGKTQADVLEKLQELKQQVAKGIFTNNNLTVKEYLEHWLEEKRPKLKPSSYRVYEMYVRYHIVPFLGKMKLEKVKPVQLQSLISSIAKSSGKHAADKCRRVLNTAFKQAVKWELIVRNPVEAVDTVTTPRHTMKLWTPEEAVRFLDAAREHRLYGLFYLAMSTGLRRGELLGLRWVDFQGNVLHVRQNLVKEGISTPKTERSQRRVSVSSDVLEVLEQHRRQQDAERTKLKERWLEHGLIFPSEIGTFFNPDNIKREKAKILEKARAKWVKDAKEIEDTATLKKLEKGELLASVRMHDFRHLHASMAIRNGVDPKVLADRLGHARASFTLDTYTHLFDEQRTQAAVSLLDFLPKTVQN